MFVPSGEMARTFPGAALTLVIAGADCVLAAGATMEKPILQEGGRQDAMIVALPAFVDPAVPVDVPLAVNAAASEVLQVRFCVIWVLDESVTVAVMFRDPFAKMKEVKLVFSTANDMD